MNSIRKHLSRSRSRSRAAAPGVPGPGKGTGLPAALLALVLLAACGDHCETLCNDVSQALARCRGTSLTWADLGAASRTDYARQCRNTWGTTSSALDARSLELALNVCQEADTDLTGMDCQQVLALYAPNN